MAIVFIGVASAAELHNDATFTGTTIIDGPVTNATLAASNVISPAVTMLPPWMIVVGDSISTSGDQFWPANFAGSVGGLTPNGDGYDSYHIVYSYFSGTPVACEVPNGVKPGTSWPEQLIELPASPTQLYNFAFAGRTAADADRYYLAGSAFGCSPFHGHPQGGYRGAGR